MSTTSVKLYSRCLLLCSVYYAVTNSCTLYTVDCVHRVHTVDCTACRMYAVKCVHLYIFTSVLEYSTSICTHTVQKLIGVQ